ncbi:PilZ domain-containing protein [Hyphococcus sp.]|uniref:PilZ domain-containing protein n=1 Tax=Hyphococcus sp. TaxID=2038636 RepID=UPI0035C785A7
MDDNLTDNRKSFRFGLTASVDVMDGVERHGFGTLIDFSRDGVGIRSMTPLNMGRKYKFHIRGVGTWSGVVVRRFDGRSYGVRFENSESEKRQIDRILMDMMDGKMDTSQVRKARSHIRAF